MNPRILFALCAFLVAGLAAQDLPSPRPEQYVTMAPAAKVAVAAGKPGVVELQFRVREGMHINSSEPRSEFLVPTKLKLNAPTDLVLGRITYPPGTEMSFPFSPKEKLSVYSGDFTITAKASAARGTTTGPYTVHGELRYQACNDKVCFPPKTLPLTFVVQVRKSVLPRERPDATSAPAGKNPRQSPHIRPR